MRVILRNLQMKKSVKCLGIKKYGNCRGYGAIIRHSLLVTEKALQGDVNLRKWQGICKDCGKEAKWQVHYICARLP